MCSYIKKVMQLALVVTLTLHGVVQAASFVDVLDLPARPSVLAMRSPLLDLGHAGQRLVAVGQRGHIVYSDDNGSSWQQAVVPVSSDLNAVYFPSAEQGWAVGNDGVVLHSSDAGATWSKQLDGRQIGDLMFKHYNALMLAKPDKEQWAVLAADGQRLIEEGADKPFLDVWFANDTVGYVVGMFNLILRTEDGGQTWTPFQDRIDNPQGFHLNAIASTGDALYIAGEQGLVLKWDDSQQRFTALETPYKGSYFGVGGQPGEVFVYGLRGQVLRSTDGGINWNRLDSGLQTSISCALLDNHGHYRLFTQSGHMLMSRGGNAPLQLVPQSQQAPVAGAILAADGALVLVGSRGVRALPGLEQ
ncbi:YCF48-related protein [Pseudomonas sp. YuFO20]|uniref:WD40/YVTN/BNR-like repeat-containing protein n=1 Tax=Pseudomonas sp. YuFO20 TaxID=3095362 RepID=UPI002B245744|nr:YCF48-related protein [Pseudomonas sp. YuFO20]MEB2519021.1 YCF48-related protein [Pseudomonas sp. YuFO20]